MTGSRRRDRPRRRRLSARARLTLLILAVAAAVGSFLAVMFDSPSGGSATLPTRTDSYLGVYITGIPHSFRPVQRFVASTGVKPNLVLYYSSWWEPFRAGFAATTARNDAVPIVQINPENVSLSAIADGRYDAYITSFATAIRTYRRPVIVGFGHEMNAQWSLWGYRHASPRTFVAAWRHIVEVFRGERVRNVTWMWTINVIDAHARSLPPGRWWPGSKYVDWVGIDGYYRRPSWRFAGLFGPTIKAVHLLTRDPILISETGVAPEAGKSAKMGNLFGGVRAYGLLGLVWFDAVAHRDWRLDSKAAIDAFRRAARSTLQLASADSTARPRLLAGGGRR
jgi:hypothetical protein